MADMHTPLLPETLRQLDALFGRTTQGSWRTYQNGVHPVEVGGMGSGEDYAICTHGPKSFANADWIATMHDEWPIVRPAIARASQDAETIKALEAQIATKDAALKVALMWSDADWVGHEIVTAALAGSAS